MGQDITEQNSFLPLKSSRVSKYSQLTVPLSLLIESSIYQNPMKYTNLHLKSLRPTGHLVNFP